MNDINPKRLKSFFDAIAETWEYDLRIISEEIAAGRDIQTFIRNRRESLNSKFIRQYWKDYVL